MNQRLFYGATEPLAGDSEYDHIVPVVGIGTTAPQATAYPPPEDTLIFSDNGLWAPDGAPPPYLFEYRFTTLPASRSAANARSAVYSLNESLNYGLAITGVADADGDTLPVRVRTDLQAEPPIADLDGSNWSLKDYEARGLVVLGFPSNDFSQEPGSDKEIADFCENTFGVKFPMFAKSRVTASAGAAANPLIADLAQRTGQWPRWNFHKYVVARDGGTVTSHVSDVDPLDKAFIRQVETLLDAKS